MNKSIRYECCGLVEHTGFAWSPVERDVKEFERLISDTYTRLGTCVLNHIQKAAWHDILLKHGFVLIMSFANPVHEERKKGEPSLFFYANKTKEVNLTLNITNEELKAL